MNISNYRTFIRERKREVNKLTTGLTIDSVFENKVNSLLEGQITSLEFETYLENDLYLSVNESYLINENLASKFADNVKSKIKSLFNNLYQKLKETGGFQMIISFFEKVVSGISKFWNFLKKINAGKLLKKLLIILGITSLASYILTQFGAGWVALMGGRMTASLVGKKIGDKVVKENLNHLMLFEDFNKDIYRVLNSFLNKINVSTNKLNSDLILKFYQNVVDPKYVREFDKWKDGLVDYLKHLKNSTNSRNEGRIKESLLMLKNHLKINGEGKSDIISDSNLKYYLSKSDGRKFGNLHGEILSILSGYNLIKTTINDESTKQDVKKDDIEKNVKRNSHKDNKFDETSNKESDSEPDSESDNQDSKKTIWSKIGSGISKFFKILRKLKWAIVIFFGVVFILNLIFFPIFEPILAIANVSSFGVVLSDTFEETVNSINSIPKVTTDNVDIKVDITGDLPGDSELTKNIQKTINDFKDNISDNPEAATNEVTDMVNNMKNTALYDAEDLESIKDAWDKIPDTFEVESKDFEIARTKLELKLNKLISDNDLSGKINANSVYDYKYFEDEKTGVYSIVAVKKDSIGGEVSDEKWNQVLGKSDVDPSQEVEEKGGFLKKLKDKIKGILPDDIDKVTKSIDKQGFEGISTNKISSGINKALESGKLDASDLDKLKNINGDDFYTFTSSSSSAARTALIEKLPSGYDSNLLVSKEIGGKTTWAYLLPKDNLEGAEEVVKEAGDKLNDYWNALGSDDKSKIREIADNLRENSEPRPGSETFEYTLVKSLESGKLSIEDLDKIEKLNTGDFYTSASPIRQNAMTALNNKLSQAGVKVDDNLIFLKELDNGNYRAYYLIPKK